MSPRGAAVSLALGAAMLLAGCSTYTPVESPAPGATVRVRVPIQSAVADRNAAPQLITLEGEVLASGDTIVLATKSRREFGAFREVILFDTIRVATAETASVDLQEFSTKKSIGLGVALTGAATYLAISALGQKSGQAGEGNPGDGTNPSGTIVLKPIVGFIWRLIGN